MKEKRQKCIDPKIGDTIPKAIVFPLAMGKQPELSPEMRQHLEHCDCCREMLPVWYRKGKGSQEMAEAFHIVNLSEMGDPGVLRKKIKSGTALFKPNANGGAKGLFVLVTPDHNIHDPEEKSLAEFNQME
jgi:hypothetical protein